MEYSLIREDGIWMNSGKSQLGHIYPARNRRIVLPALHPDALRFFRRKNKLYKNRGLKGREERWVIEILEPPPG